MGIEDAEPVIVKFYRPGRWTRQQIDEEHRFTRYLLDHEFPVVPPVVLDNSADYPTIAEYDEFLFAVYPRQGGRAPELDNLEHLHQLGRFIGQMHALGEGFAFRYRLSISVRQSAVNVEYLLKAGFIPPRAGGGLPGCQRRNPGGDRAAAAR